MGPVASKYTEAEIEQERQHLLDLSLDTRRLGYDYIDLDSVRPWPTYYEDIQQGDRISNSPFRVSDDINRKVSIWQGDITTLELDAIVNSAAKPFHGEVNLAVLTKAGEYYKAECMLRGLGAPGEALVTGGYQLPAKYVINTLAPQNRERHILENCYRNSLEAARQHNLRTVALPCIATRMKMRFKRSDAAKLALYTVRKWMEEHHPSVDRVIFCVFRDLDLQTYRKYMQEYFPVISRTVSSVSVPRPDSEQYESDDSISINEPGAVGPPVTRTLSGPMTAQGLDTWRSDTVKTTFNQVIEVNRLDTKGTFKQLVKIYQDDTIDLTRCPNVQYLGEPGVDLGAITREFFVQSLDTLTGTIFEGSHTFAGVVDHRVPAASQVQLERCIFYVIGRALAHCVLHRGLGLVGLSPAIIYLLSHDIQLNDLETSCIMITLEDVPDLELRDILSVDRANELTAAKKHKLIEFMAQCNLGYMKITNDTINYIKQGLILYEVVQRRWPQIEALRRGMDSVGGDSHSSVGLYTFLCRNPTSQNIREVFKSNEDLHVDPQLMMSKIKLEARNDQIWDFFKRLLDEVHRGLLAPENLSTLLKFWTADPLLPLGQHLVVSTDYTQQLPHAQACFSRLILPGAHTEYDTFKEAFIVALLHGQLGFGID